MPYVKKGAQTEVGRKIEELSGRLPYKEWYLPDPYDLTSYVTPIGGLTKFAKKGLTRSQWLEALQEMGLTDVFKKQINKLAESNLLSQFKEAPETMMGSQAAQAIKDAMKVVQALPRRTVEGIKKLRIDPYNKFHEGATLSGRIYPNTQNIEIFASQLKEGFPASDLASLLGHEASHESVYQILDQLAKRQVKQMPKERFLSDSPTEYAKWLSREYFLSPRRGVPFKDTAIKEGLVEYLNQAVQKKAGVPVTLKTGWPGAEEVISELEKMPSKNPYMNVYRYLQKVIK